MYIYIYTYTLYSTVLPYHLPFHHYPCAAYQADGPTTLRIHNSSSLRVHKLMKSSSHLTVY